MKCFNIYNNFCFIVHLFDDLFSPINLATEACIYKGGTQYSYTLAVVFCDGVSSLLLCGPCCFSYSATLKHTRQNQPRQSNRRTQHDNCTKLFWNAVRCSLLLLVLSIRFPKNLSFSLSLFTTCMNTRTNCYFAFNNNGS